MGDSRADARGPGLALIESITAELVAGEGENRLVPLVEAGKAPSAVFGVLAAETSSIVQSGRRSLMLLAARAEHPTVRAFFTRTAEHREKALAVVGPLAAAAGLDERALAAHEPVFGCQAAPSYMAWLAVNAEPAEAAVALMVNVDAWSRYCTPIAAAARTRYGFGDDACALLDYFATPGRPAAAAGPAVDAGLADGSVDPALTLRHSRLLRGFDLMFWNTLADLC